MIIFTNGFVVYISEPDTSSGIIAALKIVSTSHVIGCQFPVKPVAPWEKSVPCGVAVCVYIKSFGTLEPTVENWSPKVNNFY